MVRWLALAVLVVAISAASAWVSLSVPSNSSRGDASFPAPSARDEQAGRRARIVLDEVTAFDFGVMGQNETGSRVFLIGNEGPGDLRLTGTAPTCSCTVANLKPGEEAIVKPGEQFKVTIDWETRQNQGRYEKYARIETNDPKRPQLNFTVSGEVEPDVLTFPPEGNLDVRQVSNDAPHEFEAIVASPTRPETKITALSTSRPELLKLRHEPLNDAELSQYKLKSGHKVLIEVQPTADLGPFLESVVVKTDHPKRPEVRLMVGGTVVGPITLVAVGGSDARRVQPVRQANLGHHLGAGPHRDRVQGGEETGCAQGRDCAGR